MDFHGVSIFTPPGTNAYAVVGKCIAYEVQVDAKSRQVSLGKGEEKGLRAYYWKNPGVGGQRSSPLTYPRGLPVYVTASQQAPFLVDLTMRMKKNGKHARTKKSKPERIFCSIGACVRVLDQR